MAPENEPMWAGLDPLYGVANQIHQGAVLYDRLHVAQLIKHILGLNCTFEGTQNFELLYLWTPAPGHQAVQHEEEIERFQQLTNQCPTPVSFRAIRYDDLLHALAVAHGVEHGAYVDYLLERYF